MVLFLNVPMIIDKYRVYYNTLDSISILSIVFTLKV